MISDMGDKEGGLILTILMFGFIIGMFAGGIACTHFEMWYWQRAAIRHGAARYNDKTAEFKWINEEVPDVR